MGTPPLCTYKAIRAVRLVTPFSARMVVRRTVIKGTNLGQQAPEEEANVRQNKKRKKKSNAKDEIDQIFGF
jgi:hypothetical protein